MVTAMATLPDRRKKWDLLQQQVSRVRDMEQVPNSPALNNLLTREKLELRDQLEEMLEGVSSPSDSHVTTRRETKGRVGRPPGQSSDGSSKKAFVENIILQNESTSLEDIQQAWQKMGNKDTISTSLVYKVKGDLKKEGKIVGGRRGRKPGVKSQKTTSNEDINTQVRKLVWSVLSRNQNKKEGLSISNITEFLENEGMIDTSNLATILPTELKKLREEKKIERGDNRQFRIIDGAKL